MPLSVYEKQKDSVGDQYSHPDPRHAEDATNYYFVVTRDHQLAPFRVLGRVGAPDWRMGFPFTDLPETKRERRPKGG